MPKAKNKEERIVQVQGWLSYHHPCLQKVTVKWIKEFPGEDGGDWGECSVSNFTITLSQRKCRMWINAIETLLHEWAHLVRRRGESWGHDDNFWDIYGRIYRDFYDGRGCEASMEY